MATNNIRSAHRLQVGQKLTIPGRGGSGAVPSGSEKVTHTVRRGESASVIAAKYSVSLSDLLSWNKLSRTSTIRVGQKLAVYQPARDRGSVVTASATTHRVRRGESASVIADKYNVRTSDLLAWNGLSKKSVLKVGQELEL